MKNIQKQYTDLLEGKMSRANFMRNVRMEFPQYVASGNSYDDAINILKSKRILSEAAKPEGVYGHNPNAEAEASRGIDHLNYYQVYHGIQYELAKMPEITDETYIAARKKVVDTILKDPDAYKELQLANFRAVKQMDKDLEMKDVKADNLVDKPNEMKVVKKDAKGNTQDTLEKKEKKKSKDAGIKQMTQTPKKAKGIAKVMEVPGTEKTLRESTMLREENLQQYAKKIADQHNLILMPQPLDKPQLYQMWKKEKGSFGNKEGVMTFVPNTKTVNVLASDEKIPQAVFAQFKADKGGNDQGFETKTFAEDGAKGYFKNFSIADVNEAISPIASQWKVGTKFKNLKNNQVTTIEKFDDLGNVIISTDAMPNKQWTWPAEELSNMIKKGELELMEAVNEKLQALKENIMAEMSKINPTFEHFHVGARVKKKDNSLVGEITEWDGDTATIKTDEGQIHHVQGNILTKADVPTKKEDLAKTGTADEWATPKKAMNEDDFPIEDEPVTEDKEEKKKSLKEKLMKAIKEIVKVTDDKGAVVALKANTADAQEFVQGQEPAVKSKLKVTA